MVTNTQKNQMHKNYNIAPKVFLKKWQITLAYKKCAKTQHTKCTNTLGSNLFKRNT